MKTVKCEHCKSKEVRVVQGYALAVAFQCIKCNKYFVKGAK